MEAVSAAPAGGSASRSRASNGKGLPARLSGGGMETWRLNASAAQPGVQQPNLRDNRGHGTSPSNVQGERHHHAARGAWATGVSPAHLDPARGTDRAGERELTCHQTTDGHPSVSGQASARIADKLRLATERLALLRRSRQFLLSDEFLSAPYQRH